MALKGLRTTLVDVSDLSYQASPAFKPDKTALWKGPMEEDGWVQSHNAIRGELATMRTVLAGLKQPIQPWEVECIKTWWAGHKVHVHDHHSIEDEQYGPFFATRIKMPEKLTTDHKPLITMMEEIDAIVGALGGSTEKLKQKWIKYEEMMLPHLYEEEQVGLPLCRAYFAPKEMEKQVMKILANSPRLSLGSFFYHMGGTRQACAKFMANEGIPFFVWFLEFAGHVAIYKEGMAKYADALIAGVPPPPTPPSKKPAVVAVLFAIAAFAGALYLSSFDAPPELPPPREKFLGIF